MKDERKKIFDIKIKAPLGQVAYVIFIVGYFIGRIVVTLKLGGLQ